MPLRIVCREVDGSPVIHLAAPSDVTFKTFVVDAPEVEAWLAAHNPKEYTYRSIAGVEVMLGED